MVPPLPVRLLNLALNLTQAGRRLDAPLLDGAVAAQPGLVATPTVAVSTAPTADQPTFQPTPVASADVPLDAAPSFPQASEDEGGFVSQSPIDPIVAKPKLVQPTAVAIPADAVQLTEAGEAFDTLVSDEASDLDILADWPEEDAIDEEMWPDDVPPEAAAEFLMALGNVMAQNVPAPTEVTAGEDTAVDAATAASGARRPAGALPGPLALNAHMANVQANALVSGTSVGQVDGTVTPTVSAGSPIRSAVSPAGAATPTSTPLPAASVPLPTDDTSSPVAPATPSSVSTPVAPASAPNPARRPAPARRATESARPRADVADDLPIGLIPREMVQPKVAEPAAVEPVAAPIVAEGETASNHNPSGGNGDSAPDQRRNPDVPLRHAPEAPVGFVNPLAFTAAQPVIQTEVGQATDGLAVDAGVRRAVAPRPAAESTDAIGPVTVRTAETVVSQSVEAPAKAPEPTPVVTAAVMGTQQLIDAVNDGVPLHFAQFPDLVQGLVAQKPFVERTVDVVLQPENLGRIRLEVSLVDGGSAIKIAIATQTVAAQQVFESYGNRLQQIAQTQGYALKEFEVKISDRPIRSDGRGQSGGNDAAGQRQGRRRRRQGDRDDGTI